MRAFLLLTSLSRYDNVLYFLLGIKALDFALGFFYIILDHMALNKVLERSEEAQREHDAQVEDGSLDDSRGRLRDPSAFWTTVGMVTGSVEAVVAWVVYIVYAIR